MIIAMASFVVGMILGAGIMYISMMDEYMRGWHGGNRNGRKQVQNEMIQAIQRQQRNDALLYIEE
jgi:hypothetical protein